MKASNIKATWNYTRSTLFIKLLSSATLALFVLACSPLPKVAPTVLLERPAAANIPKKLQFLDQTFKKVFDDSDVNGTLHQYVLPKEAVDNWSRMFAVRFFPGTKVSPRSAVLKAKAVVDERAAQGDQFARSLVFASEDGSSFAIDFLLSHGTSLEHNVFRYYAIDTGVMCYQYSRKLSGSRITNKDVKSFVLAIPDLRSDIFEELNRADLPVPPEAIDPRAFLEKSNQLIQLKNNSVEPSSH
jgi:hypothetical protein